MGKKEEKTGLGRALVKKHNQMIQESKEKGSFYRKQHKKVLESVTEVTDIDAIVEQAEEADRRFTLDHPVPNLLINLDLEGSSKTSHMTPEERRQQQKIEESLHASRLRVPRRPPWNAAMSVEQLDASERQSFLIWRRSLAGLEENEKLVLTPFEKNLDIWRQLWRVLERSDLLVMVVDARDPLFYRCPDLEAYAQEIDEHKRTLLLVNKADLLPFSVREKWAEYFRLHNILFVFWSAKAASAALEGKKLTDPWKTQSTQNIDNPDTKIYGRDELLARLQREAEEIARMRKKSDSHGTGPSNVPGGDAAGSSASKNVVVGFVGYPNVGKSSTINALVGQKRTGVTSTPGKTKHFQTLIISDELTLCDCPGLVFPSFSSSRYEMIASGVLPIDRMTEHREAVQVVANRVPRHVIEDVYNINLPRPKSYEPQSRPPLASELLRAYCASRGYVASSGLPDETRGARQILKDYIDGKLLHHEMPPRISNGEGGFEDAAESSLSEIYDSDSCDTENPQDVEGESVPLEHVLDSENPRDVEGESVPLEHVLDSEDPQDIEGESVPLEHVLDDLNSFDMVNGLASKKVTVKKPSASYKQHKKPQRKKDRSWRVGNDNGDGMPVVRVFQKPMNTGPVKVE